MPSDSFLTTYISLFNRVVPSAATKMSPLTQAEIKSYLLLSTTRKARMFTYTNLLGLSKLSQSKSRSGPPAYTGRVREFHEAIRAAADELSRRYDSVSELHETIKTQEYFAETVIDEIIRVYGPVIWNDGRSGFLTMIDDEKDEAGRPVYPRHLIYNNERDRVRLVVPVFLKPCQIKLRCSCSIRTFIYCLTLERTCRNMRITGPHTSDDGNTQMELQDSAPRDLRVANSNVTALDPDTVPVGSREITTRTSVPPNETGSRRLQEACDYQVPVARMVTTMSTDGASSSSTMPQPDTVAVSLAIRNSVTDTEDHTQSSEASHSGSLCMPTPSLDQAPSTNSGQRGETRQSRLRRKRRRSLQGGGEADTNPSLLQLSEPTSRSVRAKRTDYSHGVSCLTSTRVASEATDMPEDEGLTNTTSNQTTRNQTNDTACATYRSGISTDTNCESDNDAIAVTTALAQYRRTADPDVHISEGSNGEVDSVVGSPRPSLVAEEQDEDNEPTLVVKPKIGSPEQIDLRRRYRRRLAAKIPSALEMWNQQPKLVEEMVALLKSIRELDAPLFQNGSGGIHAPYQLVLDQWLKLVDIYLRFRKDAEFNDDLSTWNTYCDSLESRERLRKDEIENVASLDVYNWSFEHHTYKTDEWSRRATSTLLDMACWRRALKKEDIEEIRRRFLEFTGGLVKWST